jgi:PAS domain S-box-containing protein
MSKRAADPTKQMQLRDRAEIRLREGTAPATLGWQPGLDALSLLHTLASTPGRADDALKLLHELQVHQVELDLQHEHMETAHRELAQDLARYRTLYEFGPAGYFCVGPEGDILEVNVAGADLFGVTPDELRGRRIDRFLAAESRPVFLDLLKRLREGTASDVCELRSGDGHLARRLRAVANVTPGGASFLVVFVDITDRS